MSSKIRPIPREKYQKVRGKVFFRTLAQKAAGRGRRNLGDAMAEIEMQIETTDVKSGAEPGTPKVATWVNDSNATVKITLRQSTNIGMALGLMGKPDEFLLQQAVVAGEFEIPAGTEDGEVFEILDDTGKRVYQATVTGTKVGEVATDPNDPIIVEKGLKKAGRFEVLGKQVAAVTVLYTAPAITADEKKQLIGFLSEDGVDGELVIEQDNPEGPSHEYVWPLGTLNKPGNRAILNMENDPVTQEISFEVLFDSSQPAGQERGYIQEL